MKAFVWALAAICFAGCTPTTVTQGPLTTKPNYNVAVNKTPGAIYAAGNHRPLFEDRRARFVGDILTVNIVERTNATKASGSNASKEGEVVGGINSSFGSPVPRAVVNANSSVEYQDRSAANASNAFNGSIATTVIDVLPNGFLMIAGEKQIALDKGTEFVRISGVVNPDSIMFGNVVSSSKIADARIEYRSNSRIDTAVIANILSRFFLSFIPL